MHKTIATTSIGREEGKMHWQTTYVQEEKLVPIGRTPGAVLMRAGKPQAKALIPVEYKHPVPAKETIARYMKGEQYSTHNSIVRHLEILKQVAEMKKAGNGKVDHGRVHRLCIAAIEAAQACSEKKVQKLVVQQAKEYGVDPKYIKTDVLLKRKGILTISID
jgi:hypothetical protein